MAKHETEKPIADSPAKGKQSATNKVRTQARFAVTRTDGAKFNYSTKRGGRIHDSLVALMRGPLACPSKRRVSDHIFEMRKAGFEIETEMRDQKPKATKAEHADLERFGVYHLQSTVAEIKGSAPND